MNRYAIEWPDDCPWPALTVEQAETYAGEAVVVWYDNRIETVLSGRSPQGWRTFYGHGTAFVVREKRDNYQIHPLAAFGWLAQRYVDKLAEYKARPVEVESPGRFAFLAVPDLDYLQRIIDYTPEQRSAVIDRVRAMAKKT